MVQYLEKYKRNIAIDFRKKGHSYSEIQNAIHVPKSTLSYWLKGVPLTDDQKNKLNEKRLVMARKNSEKRLARLAHRIEDIRVTSVRDVQKISKRELWLMGVMLYWREHLGSDQENDIRKGVRFTSASPHLVQMFVKWLKEVGGIADNEISFDIFVPLDKKPLLPGVVRHWAKVTDLPMDHFQRIYFQKNSKKRKRGGRNTAPKAQFGLLRTRVKASSMLARQIAGWINGIKEDAKLV